MIKMVKQVILIFIIVFLISFYFQKKFNIVKLKPLEGIKELAHKPTLNIKNISNGTYQDSLDKYFNQNMGFRPCLIRMLNQINFSLFHITKAPGVVVGKNGMLFIESYINNYIGINFVGKIKADETIRKIKQLQDSLKKMGTDLIITFAPGKASYYKEYIPDNYLSIKKDTTNYNYYSTGFIKHDINFIDFNHYFRKYETSSMYPIYPEYGAHWTSYGSALAIDSIIKYIEYKRGIDMPDFNFSQVVFRDSLNERDYDIGVLLNLSKTLPHQPMPYPKYKYTDSPNKTKPDVLIVGDSYWWCMVGEDIPAHIFKNDEYWFYNREIYKHNVKSSEVGSVNFAQEISKRDVIIIMATEATFDLFPYRFVEKGYNIFCLNNNEKQAIIRNNINNTPDWKKSIIDKAKQNKISIEQQTEKDVEYVIQNEYTPLKKDEPTVATIETSKKEIASSEYNSLEAIKYIKETIERIKKTPEWMAQIKTKAKDKGISIEEMLELDAKYTYDTGVKQKKK